MLQSDSSLARNTAAQATSQPQAALTGHLVISSLHANDAVSALLRLQDLGVPDYLISSYYRRESLRLGHGSSLS